jgi:phosphatidylserine/phosphatidylglycerophosphate/cardiolipin synthase-like enzyme
MHHKVFVIDGKTVVMGSFNFSESADEKNDENLLIIEDPELAKKYLAEFERVYATSVQTQDQEPLDSRKP